MKTPKPAHNLPARTLPSGWRKHRFSEFVQINPQIKLQSGQEYPFVEMKDLNENRKKAYSAQMRELKGGSRFINGDTLFSRITPCLENGKICQVDKLKNKQGFGSTEFLVFRGKNKISYSNFIYYLSRWQEVRSFAVLNMSGTSGRQRVLKEAFNELVLALPPLPEQKAIAEVLSSLDDKIDLLHRQNKTLENMAQALFRKWVEKFKVRDFVNAKDILEFEKGIEVGSKNYFNDKNLLEKPQKFYRVGDISHNGKQAKIFTEEKFLQNKIFGTKDVLISFDGTIGRVFIGGFGGYSTGMRKIYPKEQFKYIKNYFIYFWGKQEYTQKTIKLYSEGTTIQHASESIKHLKIISDEKSIVEIQNRVAHIFEKMCLNLEQIQTLAQIRNALLSNLISGIIRVRY